MAKLARGFGYAMVGLAAILALIGVSTWPPGGMMFALPFVFFMPAAFFAIIGAAFLWFGRRKTAAGPETNDRPQDGGT